MEALLSVALGIGLAAACGFRIFVPFLVTAIAAKTGHLTLGPSFAWIGSTPALIAFSVATVLEVGAYYVPWLDHLLDVLATPASAIAGTVLAASVVTGVDPMLKWTLAAIAGGGVAGAVQMLTVGTRKASLITTGGLGNPIVSTLELGGAAILSIVAIALPLLAVLLVATTIFVGVRIVLRLVRGPATGPEDSAA